MNSTLALLRDVYRLTKKGQGKSKMRVFENLLSEHLNTQQVMANGILSLLDLGFLYSIISLAHSSREALKKDVKWSSKIETDYLHSDYRKLFASIEKHYDSHGRFNPTARFVYDNCLRLITERVLKEVLSAYQTTPLAKVEQLTGIKTAKTLQFLRDNPELPFLMDPVTQSVVYYQKQVPLYHEAEAYFKFIKQRYYEKARALIQDSREDEAEDNDEPRFSKQSSHGRVSGRRRMMYP